MGGGGAAFVAGGKQGPPTKAGGDFGGGQFQEGQAHPPPAPLLHITYGKEYSNCSTRIHSSDTGIVSESSNFTCLLEADKPRHASVYCFINIPLPNT